MKKIEFPKDCKRIMKVIRKHCNVNEREAQHLWKTYSGDLAAGWLLLPKKDAELWDIIKEYLK